MTMERKTRLFKIAGVAGRIEGEYRLLKQLELSVDEFCSAIKYCIAKEIGDIFDIAYHDSCVKLRFEESLSRTVAIWNVRELRDFIYDSQDSWESYIEDEEEKEQ